MSSAPQISNAEPGPDARRRRRDAVVLLILLGFVVVGLLSLAFATGWEETKAQLMKLGAVQVAALLALSLVNYVLRGLRWHLFARRIGLPTGLVQDLRHFLGGFAMSVTPGRVGELIRMRWLRRETGWTFEKTAPLVLVDRASDLAATAILLAIALGLSTGGIAFGAPVVIAALLAAWVVTRPALLAWLVTAVYRATGLLPRLMARFRAAARSLVAFSGGGVIASALALGLVGWAAEGYAFHLLLGWFGADVSLAMAVAIFTFATVAGGLTGAPGGVGGAEAAMIALLTLEGVPLEISVPATAVIRVTTLWFAIGIGLAVFPLAERMSLRATR